MKIGAYEVHPAALEWPALSDADLESLTESIRAVGQREAIKVLDGAIVDGVHRARACIAAGFAPNVEHLPADTDPWEYSATVNGRRRHLESTSQRGAIVLSLLEHSGAWRKLRAEAKAEKNPTKTAKGRTGTGSRTTSPKKQRPRDVLAKAGGLSDKTAQDLITVLESDPVAFEAVRAGDVSAKQAAKDVRAKGKSAEPLNDRAGDPVPTHLVDRWRAMDSAARKVGKAIESVEDALAAALKELAPLDGVAAAEGRTSRIAGPLLDALQVQDVDKGTAAQPDVRLQSAKLNTLKAEARRALPWLVCPNCAGSAKCPGAKCLDKVLSSQCQCRGKCWFCSGLGLLTYGQHSHLSGHPAMRKAR